jgi:FAD/FMN-containing dehydrogenase
MIGKALTVGAGVQVKEALEAAHAKGLVIVGGDSSSVGLAGGYTQGGGHGPLVSKFGLAADQVLEWEVVTATGLQIKASATQNSDLYWALSGGGGGTYGIVVSATVKAHPDSQVTVASLSFFNPDQTSDAFYNTIKIFLASLTNIIDSGAVAIWLLTNEIFMIQSITAPGKSAAQVRSWLNTTFERLEVEEIPYSTCHLTKDAIEKTGG